MKLAGGGATAPERSGPPMVMVLEVTSESAFLAQVSFIAVTLHTDHDDVSTAILDMHPDAPSMRSTPAQVPARSRLKILDLIIQVLPGGLGPTFGWQ
ncbi:MAG: hypothetical protein ACYDGY_02095 [Acidimicrobiales bacterium]